MDLKPIFPGSIYLTAGEHTLLAGCPPEIIKVLLQKGLRPPDCILLPDKPVNHGESQVAIEFPLYHHLFVGCKPGELRPLHLAGSTRRVTAARELLALTLFGPDTEQMQAWNLPESEANSPKPEASRIRSLLRISGQENPVAIPGPPSYLRAQATGLRPPAGMRDASRPRSWGRRAEGQEA